MNQENFYTAFALWHKFDQAYSDAELVEEIYHALEAAYAQGQIDECSAWLEDQGEVVEDLPPMQEQRAAVGMSAFLNAEDFREERGTSPSVGEHRDVPLWDEVRSFLLDIGVDDEEEMADLFMVRWMDHIGQ